MEKKPPIFEIIDEHIKKNDVVLFMKGTPNFPMCGFSSVVSQTLQNIDVTFHHVNVMEDPEIRQGIKEYSDWPTIPQLYIKGEFIGGCDIVREMYNEGELQTLLKEKKIIK
jgi:monothiol glutaredoxin